MALPYGETPEELEQALAERTSLIELCVYAMDRAQSLGVAQRLSEGLGGIGVDELCPDGQRFDPSKHEASAAVPTNDPELDGVIAETELVGFADRDRVVRAPVVAVYTCRERVDPALSH